MFQGGFLLFWKRGGNWERWEETREDMNWEGSLFLCFAAPGWKRSCHCLPHCWSSDYSDAPLYFKT